MSRVNYEEYLKSPEWAAQRRSALFFAHNRCQHGPSGPVIGQ